MLSRPGLTSRSIPGSSTRQRKRALRSSLSESSLRTTGYSKQLQKGITQQQVRDAFAVLTRYNFFLHGYFIYGNIGETEEEMLYIPKFAKELKLDSISFQKLRIEKFSPLKEVVEADPGLPLQHVSAVPYIRTVTGSRNSSASGTGSARSSTIYRNSPYRQKSLANRAFPWARFDEYISSTTSSPG